MTIRADSANLSQLVECRCLPPREREDGPDIGAAASGLSEHQLEGTAKQRRALAHARYAVAAADPGRHRLCTPAVIGDAYDEGFAGDFQADDGTAGAAVSAGVVQSLLDDPVNVLRR